MPINYIVNCEFWIGYFIKYVLMRRTALPPMKESSNIVLYFFDLFWISYTISSGEIQAKMYLISKFFIIFLPIIKYFMNAPLVGGKPALCGCNPFHPPIRFWTFINLVGVPIICGYMISALLADIKKMNTVLMVHVVSKHIVFVVSLGLLSCSTVPINSCVSC